MACFKKRNQLKEYLIKNGVEVKVHYPIPLHLQKAARYLGYKKGNFPKAERQAKELLTLPVHQYLSKLQINFIVSYFISGELGKLIPCLDIFSDMGRI